VSKLGRNDLCHCGSSIKFKKCCLFKKEEPKLITIVKKPSMATRSLIAGLIVAMNLNK
jgi:hypothetical protein